MQASLLDCTFIYEIVKKCNGIQPFIKLLTAADEKWIKCEIQIQKKNIRFIVRGKTHADVKNGDAMCGEITVESCVMNHYPLVERLVWIITINN